MRELLKSFGLSSEQIEEVMKNHGKTVGDLQDELKDKDRDITSLQDGKRILEKQRDDYEKEVKKLKEDGTADDYKEQIDQLSEQLENNKNEYEKALANERKLRKIEVDIIGYNPHDPEDVLNNLDMEKIDLSEAGELIGFNDQMESIKERKPHYFPADNKDDGNNDEDVKPPYGTSNQSRGNSSAGQGGAPMSAREKGLARAKERHSKEEE